MIILVMDKETITYVINHFKHLFTPEEQLALRHLSSLQKLNIINLNAITDPKVELYKKIGWLSNDDSVLALLRDGEEAFKSNLAERLVKAYPNEIIFNYCPACNSLARTPQAMQCRFCGHDWHSR